MSSVPSYRFLRGDAHPKYWTPMHASGFPIAKLNRGELLDLKVEEPVLVRLSAWADTPTDFMEQPFVVVSDRMRRALERAGVSNVQYYPARLQAELSEHIESGYWLANVVGRVACVDAVASGLTDDDMTISDCQALVLDPQRTYGLGLFRLAEDPRMIVVAPRVQASLHEAKLVGVLMQDPALYKGGSAVSRAELEPLPT